MIVYVETNFVLELAFQQEQAPSCETVLRLAEDRHIQLVVPTYSLIESHGSLAWRRNQRNRALNELQQPLRELRRSTAFAKPLEDLEKPLRLLLTDSTAEEQRRIADVEDRLLGLSHCIPLDLAVLKSAIVFRRRHDLSPQDAVIYASIRAHLEIQPPPVPVSCFMNRNARDFDDPDLIEDLRTQGCKMIPRFDHAAEFIRATLGSK